MNKIKVFEAFSGYGSQSLALANINANFKVVGISEIDKYALKAYEVLHGQCDNFGDISKIDVNIIPNHDLLTYSFPCQDISISGKQFGLDINSGTRSSLLWECKRIISAKRPKFLLMENVKNLVSKRHKPYFDLWCTWLEEQGYTNYYECLNSINFGIPQNRERVFMVSILGEHKPYTFPTSFTLKNFLKDFLDKDISDKYLIPTEKQNRFKEEYSEYIKFIESNNFKTENKLIQIGLLNKNGFSQCNRVYSDLGVSPTLSTMQGGNTQPKVMETSSKSYRIRRLTETECGKLMGLTSSQISKLQEEGLSATQQYKLYGNSIVIPVLENIFKNLFLDTTS